MNDERIDYYKTTHPHWIMRKAKYSVTLLCEGHIPKYKLQSLEQRAELVDKNEDDWIQFLDWDSWIEKLNQNCYFSESSIRTEMDKFMHNYHEGNKIFNSWVIMPNHLHATTNNLLFHSKEEFVEFWRAFKSRSGFFCNKLLQRKGRFWKKSQFDRWIRNEHEERRWKDYITTNPIKAKLVNKPEQWIGLNIDK